MRRLSGKTRQLRCSVGDAMPRSADAAAESSNCIKMSYYNQGPPVGAPPPQYAPEGYPPQGYPPQGYPQQGYPPQGYPQQQQYPQQDQRGNNSPSFCEAFLAALCCCCVLDACF
ncbi:hypothetical protein M758_2G197300 [Ceratodon purpureus]|nr:hypothetical protein M758_2G197300 [Ceratodon purpureus]